MLYLYPAGLSPCRCYVFSISIRITIQPVSEIILIMSFSISSMRFMVSSMISESSFILRFSFVILCSPPLLIFRDLRVLFISVIYYTTFCANVKPILRKSCTNHSRQFCALLILIISHFACIMIVIINRRCNIGNKYKKSKRTFRQNSKRMC